jgi:hypothetical protein
MEATVYSWKDQKTEVCGEIYLDEENLPEALEVVVNGQVFFYYKKE